MSKNIVIVGAGVAGINAATKLVENNYKGKITIIFSIYIFICLNVII
jgi:NADH dehydrogenase FAD-containing subunit